jgi:transposase
MEAYAGIDLHSSNSYIGIINQDNEKLFGKKMPNDLDQIINVLNPFKKDLKAIVIESTYNWYWLVDGLQEQGYPMHLANPAATKHYEGIKHTDDKWDSFWLAELKRLNILREGYIYPKKDRPVRDLLRRRMLFVQNKTTHVLSLQSMITRQLGMKMSGNEVLKLKPESAKDLFDSPNLALMARNSIETILFLKKIVNNIEKAVISQVKVRKEFELLKTIPGIGDILALTIMLEVGDIGRFLKAGNFSSYSRCVNSVRLSNGKKKGENNRKNGNRYLSWAYVEAANFARRFCPKAQRFFQRKMAKTNKIIATKALGNKMCRASYFIMRDQTPYDVDRVFP